MCLCGPFTSQCTYVPERAHLDTHHVTCRRERRVPLALGVLEVSPCPPAGELAHAPDVREVGLLDSERLDVATGPHSRLASLGLAPAAFSL